MMRGSVHPVSVLALFYSIVGERGEMPALQRRAIGVSVQAGPVEDMEGGWHCQRFAITEIPREVVDGG